MAIEAWSEPIYHRQKGEVDREWRYKKPFLEWDGDLLSYSELLDYAFKKECTPHIPSPNKIYDDFLEDHPIKFHKDDKKKGSAPTHEQLKNWSKGSNVKCEIKHTWIEIRSVKRTDESNANQENVRAIKNKHIRKIANAAISDIDDIYELKKKLKYEGKLTLSQAKAGSEAVLTNLQIIDNLGSENPNEFDINLAGEIKSETEIKTDKQIRLEKFQKQIIEGKAGQRLEDELKKEGVLPQ